MDDIVLPALTPMPLLHPERLPAWVDEIRRAAVIADRERRAESVPAPPKAHKAMVYLGDDGFTRIYNGNETVARPIIRWTNDGRVWIDSEDRRGVASELRRCAALWLRSESAYSFAATCARAADLLDGGESC